jgi:hypothetical protein
MVGQGMLLMDVTLFVLLVVAWGIQWYLLPSRWRLGAGMTAVHLLRMVGFSVIVLRCGLVLYRDHDIAISVESAMALMFLCAAEIALVLNYNGRKGRVL